MQFVVDTGVGTSIELMLRELGHTVVTVRDIKYARCGSIGLSGPPQSLANYNG